MAEKRDYVPASRRLRPSKDALDMTLYNEKILRTRTEASLFVTHRTNLRGITPRSNDETLIHHFSRARYLDQSNRPWKENPLQTQRDVNPKYRKVISQRRGVCNFP